MSAFERLVAETLAAPLAAARRHASRGTVIGYAAAEVPVEILRASDAFAVRLPAPVLGGTPRADTMLESSFMPPLRAIAEQYLRGEFDFMQTIVFPRSNDSAQRLYYYLSEHQRAGHAGPELRIYDLAKIPRAASLDHTRFATRRLARELNADVNRGQLAVQLRNRRAHLVSRAGQLRLAGRLPGSAADRLARAAGFCEPQAFDDELAAWLDAAPRATRAGPRVLLVGSAPPDERLHRLVEAAGGNVVAESGDHAFCESQLLEPVASYDALAHAYHVSAFGPRAFADRAARLRDLAGTSGAAGVIFWLVEEEDAFIWDLPAQRAALDAAGIPQLVLTRRRWDAADDTGHAIEAFVRGLPGGAP